MSDERLRRLERAAALGDPEAIARLSHAREQVKDVRNRPILHFDQCIAFDHRITLCRNPRRNRSARWAPWRKDGEEDLAEGKCLSCDHEATRMTMSAFLRMLGRQLAVSRTLRITPPSPERLGVRIALRPNLESYLAKGPQ